MKKIIDKIIHPKSKNADAARREFISNILLLCSTVLSFLAAAIAFMLNIRRGNGYSGLPVEILFAISFFFLFLLLLSRKGFWKISSFFLIVAYLLPAVYANYRWGIALFTVLLVYALVLVVSGILISTQASMVVLAVVAIIIFTFTSLQEKDIITPDTAWQTTDKPGKDDAIVNIVILSVIGAVSWLHNREIENALRRARKSEKELIIERDSLEIKVEERTRELKRTQLEEINQLYRFSEFGKLASGLFHDLVNPLTALNLSLKQLDESKNETSKETKTAIEYALLGAKKMEDFLRSIRKQIQKQEIIETFNLKQQLEEVINIFSYRLKKAHVSLEKDISEKIQIEANPLKFHQIISNLFSNALDAYEAKNITDGKISIKIKEGKNLIKITFRDDAGGINQEQLPHIFDSQFTTKSPDHGTGIGLSITKQVIEQDFGGQITAESRIDFGTTFYISIPKLKNEPRKS